jgi:hypothetical protein
MCSIDGALEDLSLEEQQHFLEDAILSPDISPVPESGLSKDAQ